MNHSTENSTNFRESKVEWKENFWENIFENLGILHEVVLCFGKCRSIPFWKLNENVNKIFWLDRKYLVFSLKLGFSRRETHNFSVKPVTGLTACTFFTYSKVRAGTLLYLSMDGTVSKFWRRVCSPLDAVDTTFSSLYMIQYARLLYAILWCMVSMQRYDMINN